MTPPAVFWNSPMTRFDKIVHKINCSLVGIGGAFLVAMILLTAANIVMRALGLPIKGTFELMGYFGAGVAAFALGYTQMRKGHIAVDVLVASFSARTQRLLTAVNNLVCSFFLVLMAWQVGSKAAVLFRTEEVSETLRIVYYPFTCGVAVGCGFLAIVFLRDLVAVFRPPEGERS